jgi:iron(III) transport system substrate-binding protein
VSDRRSTSRRRFLQQASLLSGFMFAGLAGACAPAVAPTPSATSAPKPAAAASPASAPAAAASPAAVTTPIGDAIRAAAAASPVAAASPLAITDPVIDAATVEAAKREGKAVVYASDDPVIWQRVTADIKKRYGLDIEFNRLLTAAMVQRFTAEVESNNNQADVVSIGDPEPLEDFVKKGWFARLTDLPSVTQFPTQWRTDFTASLRYVVYGLAWNSQAVSAADEPKDWKAVLDPKWRGQILMVDPRATVGANYFFYMLRETQGEDFLRQLGQQNPKPFPSVVPGAQQLAAGGGAFIIPGNPETVAGLQATGAPLKDAYPAPTTAAITNYGMSGKAPRPNAAKVLLNYLLSAAGQQMLNQGAYGPMPTVPGVKALPAGFIPPKFKEATEARASTAQLLGLT